MPWNNSFKLGLPGAELDFPCQVLNIDVAEGNIEVMQRTLAGRAKKSYLRTNVPTLTLQLARLTDSLLSVLRGLQQATSPLNFIYNNTLAIKYQTAVSQSTTSVVIPLNSASGVTITGVFLQTDVAQSGTNYYSGGSTYDPTTGTLTLATPLPGANTAVWVNYTFSGINCWAQVRALPHQGLYKDYWQATLTLTGL